MPRSAVSCRASSQSPVTRTIGPCAPDSRTQAWLDSVWIVGTARAAKPRIAGHQPIRTCLTSSGGATGSAFATTSRVIQDSADDRGMVGAKLRRQGLHIGDQPLV